MSLRHLGSLRGLKIILERSGLITGDFSLGGKIQHSQICNRWGKKHHLGTYGNYQAIENNSCIIINSCMQTFWQASWKSNPALWKCYNPNNSMELWYLSSMGWVLSQQEPGQLQQRCWWLSHTCICVSQGQLRSEKKGNKICPSQWRFSLLSAGFLPRDVLWFVLVFGGNSPSQESHTSVPTASTHSASAVGEESLSLANNFTFCLLKNKTLKPLTKEARSFSVSFSCI